MGTETELITERAIGADRPLPEEQALDLLHRYFVCPHCGNISRLFAVNEFYGEDGSVVGREYYLSCHDVEDLPPEEARNGTLPFRKVHHRVSSLAELEEVKITRTKPNVEVFLHAHNYDAEGRLTRRLIQRSDSFLPNFLGMLCSQMESQYATGTVTSCSGPNTGNTSSAFIDSYNQYINAEMLATGAPSGNANYGIQVGTGTAANSTTTYALASQIPNGTGSGQLSYGSGAASWSAGSTSTTAVRTFSNSSGASVTVSEVGLVWASNFSCTGTGGTPCYFIMIRDVLSSPVSIANGGNTTFQYTISITVS